MAADWRRCRVLLFRGRGLLSALIRWQTRSTYAHAAFQLPDGRVLESWPGEGVRVTTLADRDGVERFSVPALTPAQWREAIGFAFRELGAKYDWIGVARFVSRLRGPSNDRWFCSELVAAAISEAGLRLLDRVPPVEVSPHLLSLSPHLVKEEES